MRITTARRSHEVSGSQDSRHAIDAPDATAEATSCINVASSDRCVVKWFEGHAQTPCSGGDGEMGQWLSGGCPSTGQLCGQGNQGGSQRISSSACEPGMEPQRFGFSCRCAGGGSVAAPGACSADLLPSWPIGKCDELHLLIVA